MDVFELQEWFSIDEAAARLSLIEGGLVSPDTAWQYLCRSKLQASVYSIHLFVTPLVSMTEAQRETFVGTSWTKPDGTHLAPTRDVIVLTEIDVLDLPWCPSLRRFLHSIRTENHANDFQLPPGTLIQIPNKDEYFAVLGGTDIPATFGQVVIRTDALREFQSRLIVHTRAVAANDGDNDDTASEPKEQRQDRRLKACEDAGLSFKDYKGRLPDGVGDVASRESVTRQAFSKDVKAALKRRESAKREGVTVHLT